MKKQNKFKGIKTFKEIVTELGLTDEKLIAERKEKLKSQFKKELVYILSGTKRFFDKMNMVLLDSTQDTRKMDLRQSLYQTTSAAEMSSSYKELYNHVFDEDMVVTDEEIQEFSKGDHWYD